MGLDVAALKSGPGTLALRPALQGGGLLRAILAARLMARERIVGAEAPEVALGVAHAELARAVVGVRERPHDRRAGRARALPQHVDLLNAHVDPLRDLAHARRAAHRKVLRALAAQ